MNIKQILKKYYKVEIELLLAHVLRKPKEFIFLNSEKKLSSYQVSSLSRLIKRRLRGEPMAYILGYKNFYGMRFKVNKDVLVPRPETEFIVSRVIASAAEAILLKKRLPHPSDALGARNDILKILDLGTGSGCIIISLAKALATRGILVLHKDAPCRPAFYASDISKKALLVAKFNAKKYRVKIKFIQSDLFANTPGKFDFVVANLPYIPLKILRRYLLHTPSPSDPFAALKFEPAFALTDGSSSWQIYRRFFEQVKPHIKPGGLILLEIDPSSRKFLIEYQKKYLSGWKIKFYRDFNNLWRYAEISLQA